MTKLDAVLTLVREVDQMKEAKFRAHNCAQACVVLGLSREEADLVRSAVAIDYYADEFSKELARRGV